MDRPIRWGIVGLGKIARTFAEDLQRTPDAIIHAVASRNVEKAEDFAREFGATHAYGSYEALLSCPDLDVVYIATPHHLHPELSILFLEHQIAVLCEKPLGMNEQQVISMTNAAQRHNTFLMEAIWTRFFPTFRKALELLKSGEIGDIELVRADFGFHSSRGAESRIFNASLGGGALLDVGLYPVFLALQTLGKPDSIAAKSTFTSTGVDATTLIRFDYANGAMADLSCSVTHETSVIGEVYGSKGKMKFHPRFHHSPKLTWQQYGEEEQVFEIDVNHNGYGYEIEEVHQCLRDNKKESDLLPHKTSRELIQTLDEIRKAIGLRYSVDSV